MDALFEWSEEHVELVALALDAVINAKPGTDWNELERRAFSGCAEAIGSDTTLQAEDVYLGGDTLRPYLALHLPPGVLVASLPSPHLTQPRLLQELVAGELGPAQSATRNTPSSTVNVYGLRITPANHNRFITPQVMLASLTNAHRYQTRRYPLGIARLSQWLRFQHVARVRVIDMALAYPNNVEGLAREVAISRPHILGLSLNFGELPTLRELIAHLRSIDHRPVLAIGNVLAAWAVPEVSRICEGFTLAVSLSYGEADLEELCTLYHETDERKVAKPVETFRGTFPSVIVMPDEKLLVDTLVAKGQASLETSFGCQYGRCTFCPRDHRSEGWRRPGGRNVAAVIERMADVSEVVTGTRSGIISIVDEEAFGDEELSTNGESPSIVEVLREAERNGQRCEIYTRLEQLYHPRRSPAEAEKRVNQLRSVSASLSRVFVGVESGSDGQLRRYGKGQTTQDIVAALRVASLLGLPMEFGFITFDPLLSISELIANLEFLARRDVMLPAETEADAKRILAKANGGQEIDKMGEPLFRNVAYMATELEVFRNSAYLRLLQRKAPSLVGQYDVAFARYVCSYADPVVNTTAAWCRVWTEGTFGHIYRIRLEQRATGRSDSSSTALIERYRNTTFGLLVALTRHGLSDDEKRHLVLSSKYSVPLERKQSGMVDVKSLYNLWEGISDGHSMSGKEDVSFDLSRLELRRDS